MSTEGRDRSSHAFSQFRPRVREGVGVVGRRSVLKASLAGLGAWSVPRLLAARESGDPIAPPRRKSVILIWMTGGPSHIDTLDPKPLAPAEIRGPFDVISTKTPGAQVCEYLPKYAALTDRLTVLRSVDCRKSNHEPNMVMQTGNLDAEPRINREGGKFPAWGAVVAKERGTASRTLPQYVVLNMKSRSHVAWGGYLGKSYDPFLGNDVNSLFQLQQGLTMDRLYDRRSLSERFDRLQRDLDLDGSLAASDAFMQQAVDMIAGQRAKEAFDLTRESAEVHQRYGGHEWSQQALLARRLIEAGVSFVTIDLSNHGASGTWDTHGDNIPPYGGIWNGLRPLLPIFDHLFTTLIQDLDERGLLDDVLVLAMGEFGRTPQIGTQGSTDGRDHWVNVMSMTMAGGGLKHGQVIGASDAQGAYIHERPVTPGDLTATIFRHLGVPLNYSYTDGRGRPRFMIDQGSPISELFA